MIFNGTDRELGNYAKVQNSYYISGLFPSKWPTLHIPKECPLEVILAASKSTVFGTSIKISKENNGVYSYLLSYT